MLFANREVWSRGKHEVKQEVTVKLRIQTKTEHIATHPIPPSRSYHEWTASMVEIKPVVSHPRVPKWQQNNNRKVDSENLVKITSPAHPSSETTNVEIYFQGIDFTHASLQKRTSIWYWAVYSSWVRGRNDAGGGYVRKNNRKLCQKNAGGNAEIVRELRVLWKKKINNLENARNKEEITKEKSRREYGNHYIVSRGKKCIQ